MIFLRVLSFLLLLSLGTFHNSVFGHAFMVDSVWQANDHNHSIPDHEIHHSEDVVYRWNIISHNEAEYPQNTEYPTNIIYDYQDEPYVGYIFYRQKIFDKQSFFFSDTIRLLL